MITDNFKIHYPQSEEQKVKLLSCADWYLKKWCLNVLFQTGELLFFDLVSKKVVSRSQVDAKIHHLSLIQDDQHNATSLLVSDRPYRTSLHTPVGMSALW